MTATVSGYSHVTVVVDDLDVAIAFYRDALGFVLLPRPDTLGPGAWLQVGSAQLHIVVVDELGPPPKGLPHLALQVPAEEWDTTIAALEARGTDFLRPPRAREDFGRVVRAAFIHDPAGNVIELTDVGPNSG